MILVSIQLMEVMQNKCQKVNEILKFSCIVVSKECYGIAVEVSNG